MGSAEVQGELWSTNPAAWAEGAERKNQPLFEAVLERLDPRPGTAVLDAGCGSGLFAELAAERGLRGSGPDAAPGLVDHPSRRAPARPFTLGGARALPSPHGALHHATAVSSV